MTFVTEDGPREPVRFRNFVVPGKSVVAVDVGDDVTRRDHVSTTVDVSRRPHRRRPDPDLRRIAGAEGTTLTLGTPNAG